MLEILTITGPIFIIIAGGFTSVRLAFFSKSGIRALGMFVINFALPALIFKALSQRPFAEIMNVNYLLAYALGSLAVMSIGMSVAYFGQKKSLPASTLHGMGMSFSNSGFIGYPIALQLLGPPASVALALNLIVENMLMIPLALTLAESGTNKGGKWHSVLLKSFTRLLKNPIILSILAGSTFAILEIPLPEPITRAIDMLALASAPAALFVIGGTLVGLRVKGMIGDVGQIMLGKLLLHPPGGLYGPYAATPHRSSTPNGGGHLCLRAYAEHLPHFRPEIWPGGYLRSSPYGDDGSIVYFD